jgi:hypothetical protein
VNAEAALLKSLFRLVLVALLFAGAEPALARHHHHHHDEDAAASGLAGDTLLIIRHAEKPEGDNSGPGLAPGGEARAKAYASYFQHLRIDGAPVKIDAIIATADSQDSERPRLTVTPFAQASGLKIEQPFPDKEVKALAHWLAAGAPHRTILIAWHHGRLPKLLNQLGANPDEVLPDGFWPEDAFDWVIVLRYDGDGQLSEEKRIVEPAFAD